MARSRRAKTKRYAEQMAPRNISVLSGPSGSYEIDDGQKQAGARAARVHAGIANFFVFSSAKASSA